ncbi:D-alanyl-D-alanine carboxypeptidase family protein [Oceanobacillus senegalensis]|uniref:D-alanyl-D-alanine carboxypeptidase family protein n=1 Tax=Oceanobacillus senegalensis TaxID=1936063 RepID=UPI000A30D41C|nr:D-alanyl-D-alanine carboxypeptidase family protein [Oceanobacillus senegalensis]
MLLKRIMIACLFICIFTLLSACSTDEPSESTDEVTSEPTSETAEETESLPTEAIFPEVELQKKDVGKHVKLLQYALNQIGYDLKVNGTYDEATTWAITDFQLQHEELMDIGVYNEETRAILKQYLNENNQIDPGLGLPYNTETTSTQSGSKIIGNPYDQLSLINKDFALPADYIPEDLVVPDVRFPFTEDLPKKQMREVAARALEDLFEAADEEGLELFAQSGYRSFERQEAIFTSNVNLHGEEAANTFSARPGESEHQTGLTMDVTSPDIGFKLIVEFGETDEGKWIAEHAADFGFIIRYPKGKEEITQYQYEPWHLRYVGEKAAKEITEKGITLEEYLL